MQFHIADTCAVSLARLTDGQERAAKNTTSDFQTNLSHLGFSLHWLISASAPVFWVGPGELGLVQFFHPR